MWFQSCRLQIPDLKTKTEEKFVFLGTVKYLIDDIHLFYSCGESFANIFSLNCFNFLLIFGTCALLRNFNHFKTLTSLSNFLM